MFLEIPKLLDRLCYRFPSLLIDSVIEHEPGTRLVAVKNVTGNEEVLEGHFPGTPVMPGVLMIEALMQAASVLLLDDNGNVQPSAMRTVLRGVNNARFRRLVVPGDQIRLEVTIRRRRRRVAVAAAVARVGDHVVAEAELLVGLALDEALIDPTANVAPGAEIGAGTVIGPNVVVGPHVRIGRACNIGASAVIDGWTEIGDETQVFPFASIGLIPQDQKFKGERTRLVIGRRNIFREFVTIHRGTKGGGGVTRIGDDNLFMAYVHVAHDCQVGDRAILANAANLGGHVTVEDEAFIGAVSGVHQYCRVGRNAFIGGASVVTLDALPFVRSVGNRARIYDLNTIGLVRHGMPQETIDQLKRAFRYLLQSRLNRTQALLQIEQDDTLQCAEVLYLVEFIRTSRRGVNLRRPPKRLEAMVADE
ncbi:MAG: acyl-ACP--UDP-N-acetylglucosamine O-acyltransferase [Vicinamibacterales bacterium]|nr:acyl-ACP--UDP-N-acetylglucosamine O-acyltransferase [Vicinamibacterales bacterium]